MFGQGIVQSATVAFSAVCGAAGNMDDTHKTLTPIVSGGCCNINDRTTATDDSGGGGGGGVGVGSDGGGNSIGGGGSSGIDDNSKEDDDKRNCISLPLCYDRVSSIQHALYSL